MLILIAILLVLVPASAILYPVLRMREEPLLSRNDFAIKSELDRRWDTALFGLKNTELERALGNLTEEDYLWLVDFYKTDAALVMKAMELEKQEEVNLLKDMDKQVLDTKERILGKSNSEGDLWKRDE